MMTTIEIAVIMGRTCRPGGAIGADLPVTMTTDGLTLDLSFDGAAQTGQLSIACKGGMGMSMPGRSAPSGTIISAMQVKAGDTKLVDDWTAPVQAMVAEVGASFSDPGEVILSITCGQ